MYELALFAGAGGGILGGKLLGWRTVCAVEIHDHNRAILAARQNDGCLGAFPVWDDVRSFTKRNNETRRIIRQLRRIRHKLVVTGGFPCQDISSAGDGGGIDGERSGLWREFARIIREIRPRHVLVENSPMLTSRGLGRVLGDLAEMGYDARWGVLGAEDAIWALGTPCLDHERERIWIVATCAYAPSHRRSQRRSGNDGLRASEAVGEGGPNKPRGVGADAGTGHPSDAGADALRHGRSERRSQCDPVRGDAQPASFRGEVFDADRQRLEKLDASTLADSPRQSCRRLVADGRESWWATEPDVGRVADGVAARVDRLYGIGNGQLPQVVRLAWNILADPNE